MMMFGGKQQDTKAAFGLEPLPDPMELVDNLIESAGNLSLQGHTSPISVTALTVELIARGATTEAAAIMSSDRFNHIPFIRREGGRQLVCKSCGLPIGVRKHKCPECQKANWARTLETGGWAAIFKSRDRRGWVPEISKRPSRPADLLHPVVSRDRDFPPPPLHDPKNKVTDTYRPDEHDKSDKPDRPNADAGRKSFREGADTCRTPRAGACRPPHERSDPFENAFETLSLNRRRGRGEKAAKKAKRAEQSKDDRKADHDAIKAERKKEKQEQSTGEMQNSGSEAPVNIPVPPPAQQALPGFDITTLQRCIDSLSLGRITHKSQPIPGVQP
jgi:hypothetical protein